MVSASDDSCIIGPVRSLWIFFEVPVIKLIANPWYATKSSGRWRSITQPSLAASVVIQTARQTTRTKFDRVNLTSVAPSISTKNGTHALSPRLSYDGISSFTCERRTALVYCIRTQLLHGLRTKRKTKKTGQGWATSQTKKGSINHNTKIQQTKRDLKIKQSEEKTTDTNGPPRKRNGGGERKVNNGNRGARERDGEDRQDFISRNKRYVDNGSNGVGTEWGCM